MNGVVVTLEQFIIENEKDFPFATGELSRLLRDIGLAGRVIRREVSKAGLVDILGIAGKHNVHGEQVQKLDMFAHDELIKALGMGGVCRVLGSEESADVIPLENPDAHYVVLFDPLDGSSNIDVNVSIGTIFSIYRCENLSEDPKDLRREAMQRGDRQVAAGYIVYGSSTMLVYTTGRGVNGFTLDPSIGEFLLSHPGIRIPPRGKYYSVNQGYYHLWDEPLRRYIHYLQEVDETDGRPYGLRYIGTLVADVHRTLLYGGIFMYPGMSTAPKGKLRLLYECNPMAFIIEQAGGRATDGRRRILEIEPESLHQRTPLFIGSTGEVERAESYLNGG